MSDEQASKSRWWAEIPLQTILEKRLARNPDLGRNLRGAQEEDIKRIEAKVGPLPPDYRAFLQIVGENTGMLFGQGLDFTIRVPMEMVRGRHRGRHKEEPEGKVRFLWIGRDTKAEDHPLFHLDLFENPVDPPVVRGDRNPIESHRGQPLLWRIADSFKQFVVEALGAR